MTVSWLSGCLFSKYIYLKSVCWLVWGCGRQSSYVSLPDHYAQTHTLIWQKRCCTVPGSVTMSISLLYETVPISLPLSFPSFLPPSLSFPFSLSLSSSLFLSLSFFLPSFLSLSSSPSLSLFLSLLSLFLSLLLHLCQDFPIACSQRQTHVPDVNVKVQLRATRPTITLSNWINAVLSECLHVNGNGYSVMSATERGGRVAEDERASDKGGERGRVTER